MRKYYVLLIAALGMLIAIWVFGALSFQRLAQANRAMLRTQQVLAISHEMIEAVYRMESVFQRYSVTGIDAHRETWESQRETFLLRADSLEVLHEGDERRNRRLNLIRHHFHEWRAIQQESGIFSASPEERRTLLLEAIDDPSRYEEREVAASEIVQRLREIQTERNAWLREATSRTRDLDARAEAAAAGAAAFTFLFAFGAGLLLLRRTRDLQDANRLLEEEMDARTEATREVQRISEQQSLILDTAADGIIGANELGIVVFMNPSATRILGPQTLAVGDSIDRVLVSGDSDQNALTEPLDTGKSQTVADAHFHRADGSEFPVDFVSAPVIEDGEITGVVVTFRDTSEQRAVARMKDEFISIVSHELRTPLTSIRGSLGLLASGRMTTLEPSGKRMLDIAVESTDRLVRLINDILSIERMESGKVALNMEPVQLDEIGERAAESMRGVAEQAGVSIELEVEPTPAVADTDAIHQVLTNLLSNAVKFSERGESVTLRIASMDDGSPEVSVRDRGRGIPAEHLESVFTRFHQVDSSDARAHAGTGLGLAICRSIVEKHDGRIWAESVVGEGSAFIFTLPPPSRSGGPESDKDLSYQAPLVLVWKDDGGSVEAERLLHEHGYRTVQADGCDALLRDATRLSPEAILMDVGVPQMNCLETLATLREREETREIPIVVLSDLVPENEDPTDDDRVKWIAKPFEPETLVQAVLSARSDWSPARHILVVEDDENLARVLLESFAQHEIPTEHARSGREALQMADRSPPAVVVLDLALPEGNGEWVVAWMRRHERLRDTNLVVYSARNLSNEERTRLRLGHTSYITKGDLPPEEVERRIVEIFREVVTPEHREPGR